MTVVGQCLDDSRETPIVDKMVLTCAEEGRTHTGINARCAENRQRKAEAHLVICMQKRHPFFNSSKECTVCIVSCKRRR